MSKAMAQENKDAVDELHSLGLTILTPESMGVGWSHHETRTAPPGVFTKAFKYDHGEHRFEVQLRAKRFAAKDRIEATKGRVEEETSLLLWDQCLEWLKEIQHQKGEESNFAFTGRVASSINRFSKQQAASELNASGAFAAGIDEYRLAPLPSSRHPDAELVGFTISFWGEGVLAMVMFIFTNPEQMLQFLRDEAGLQVLSDANNLIRFIEQGVQSTTT